MASEPESPLEEARDARSYKRQRLNHSHRIMIDSNNGGHHNLGSMDTHVKTDVADIFRRDLENIRDTVTCTICRQLLYEPWTLACGHTYCYSCLCNWFIANKKKMTCPDCRMVVRSMPASAFLIKQIVQTFINQVQLMPGDETVDQHKERKGIESDLLELDKASSDGLFKGCFDDVKDGPSLSYDEVDHVVRCTRCFHEYEGGSRCQNCNANVHGDVFEIVEELSAPSESNGSDGFDTDRDDQDMGSEPDDFDSDHDGPLGDEARIFYEQFAGTYGSGQIRVGFTSAADLRELREREHARHDAAISDRSRNGSDDTDSEDMGSLRDFLVDDDEPEQPIDISSSADEDSDDDEEIRIRHRVRRGGRIAIPSSSPVYSSRGDSVSETGSHELGDPVEEDTDDFATMESRRRRMRARRIAEEDDSDSNTMVGNLNSAHTGSPSVDEDSEDEAPLSPNSRRSAFLQRVMRGGRSQHVLPCDNDQEDQSDWGDNSSQEGDANESEGEDEEEGLQMDGSLDGSRGSSVTSGEDYASRDLGMTSSLVDPRYDYESEGSIRAAARRRRLLADGPPPPSLVSYLVPRPARFVNLDDNVYARGPSYSHAAGPTSQENRIDYASIYLRNLTSTPASYRELNNAENGRRGSYHDRRRL